MLLLLRLFFADKLTNNLVNKLIIHLFITLYLIGSVFFFVIVQITLIKRLAVYKFAVNVFIQFIKLRKFNHSKCLINVLFDD